MTKTRFKQFKSFKAFQSFMERTGDGANFKDGKRSCCGRERGRTVDDDIARRFKT
jgi:hypothetical protein